MDSARCRTRRAGAPRAAARTSSLEGVRMSAFFRPRVWSLEGALGRRTSTMVRRSRSYIMAGALGPWGACLG